MAMLDLKDDPRIRDAENNGWGTDAPDPVCPVCKRECERIYHFTGDREPIGCENCIEWDDAGNWDFEEEED